MIVELALLAAAAPRVLSADFCADQLVLTLAAPTQIAGLSPDADKDFSFLRDRAAGFPQRRADAEAVMAARADVVLRFWGGDAGRLERLGVRVVTLHYAADFDGVRRNIAAAAAALHREHEGQSLIDEMDVRLEALEAKGVSGVT